MSISFKVRDFPTFPIEKQLFHVPGASVDGGFTVGGSRLFSPEPGGRSMLELQPAMQINEWDFPFSSWLMSKINGEIFKVRLAPTPQVLQSRTSLGALWAPSTPWDNNQPWAGDLISTYQSNALEGTNVVVIDMSSIGPRLQPGHIIGHGAVTYKVDEINYDANNVATITVMPPIRNDISPGDTVLFRPYFTGAIANGDTIRQTYDAGNAGIIQLGSIVFNEVIL